MKSATKIIPSFSNNYYNKLLSGLNKFKTNNKTLLIAKTLSTTKLNSLAISLPYHSQQLQQHYHYQTTSLNNDNSADDNADDKLEMLSLKKVKELDELFKNTDQLLVSDMHQFYNKLMNENHRVFVLAHMKDNLPQYHFQFERETTMNGNKRTRVVPIFTSHECACICLADLEKQNLEFDKNTIKTVLIPIRDLFNYFVNYYFQRQIENNDNVETILTLHALTDNPNFRNRLIRGISCYTFLQDTNNNNTFKTVELDFTKSKMKKLLEGNFHYEMREREAADKFNSYVLDYLRLLVKENKEMNEKVKDVDFQVLEGPDNYFVMKVVLRDEVKNKMNEREKEMLMGEMNLLLHAAMRKEGGALNYPVTIKRF